MRFVMILTTGIALLSCVPASVSPSGGASGATAGGTASSVAIDVVSATNAERTRRGLTALRVSSKLMEAARIHAAQMAAFQRADHVIPEAQYPTPQSRLDATGYVFSAAGENVAWNQSSAQAAVDAWMSSSPHRANILSGDYTEIGAAMTRSARGEPYWVQVFGAPR
jgi:uncharacterized protein YkwD